MYNFFRPYCKTQSKSWHRITFSKTLKYYSSFFTLIQFTWRVSLTFTTFLAKAWRYGSSRISTFSLGPKNLSKTRDMLTSRKGSRLCSKTMATDHGQFGFLVLLVFLLIVHSFFKLLSNRLSKTSFNSFYFLLAPVVYFSSI